MMRTVEKVLVAVFALALAGPVARAEVKLARESFYGTNSRGPYTLQRLQTEVRSESVFRNGLRLQRGRDYLYDENSGILSFSETVRPNENIEVDYRYDTARAKAAGAFGGTLGLFTSAYAGVGLTYNFVSDKAGTQKLSNIGLEGNANIGAMQFSSRFLMDETAKKGGSDAQAVNLSAKQESGRLKFEAAYSQVGLNFGQAQAMKLVKGSSSINVAGSYQLGANSLLTAKRTAVETPDAKTGKVTSTFLDAATLAMNVGKTGKFNALHEAKSEVKDGATVASRVDRLAYEHRLGPRTVANLVQESISSEKGGKGESLTASRFNIATTGSGNLKIDAGVALLDNSKSGSASEANLKVSQGTERSNVAMSLTGRQAAAGDAYGHSLVWNLQQKGLKLQASNVGDVTNGKTRNQTLVSVDGGKIEQVQFGGALLAGAGDKSSTGYRLALASKRSKAMEWALSRNDEKSDKGDLGLNRAGLTLRPMDGVSLVASWADEWAGNKEKSLGNVTLEAKPGDALKMMASLVSKDDEKGQSTGQSVAVEAKPGRDLQFAASYGTTDDPTGTTEASKVTVAAGGRAVKVGAAYTGSDAPNGLSSLTEASLSLSPGEFLKMTGSYREESKPTGDVMVAILAADFRPAAALAMTGSYKQRDGTKNQPDTVNAQVTLKPFSALQLVGTYSENPEEKDQIIRTVRKGLALTSTLGALGLTAGYIDEQNLLDGADGARAEFKLNLRLSRYADVQGGYEQTVGQVRGLRPLMGYNMRFTQRMGSDFNLNLEGNWMTKDYGMPTEQDQEVKATANLGIRF